ncbi:gluconokinase [Rhodococcus hoagii]|nr:gluconokinase [Prescottella equi]
MPRRTRHVVVMGVSGCGKSTVGSALAAAVGAEFLDADTLHPRVNIDKMSAGIPLTDDDRLPWLAEVGERFAGTGHDLVVACSALTRAYRDVIRNHDSTVTFMHLHGPPDVLADRMRSRPGHFMPTSLLDSQLATLEPLQPDEDAITVDFSAPVVDLVAGAIESWWRARNCYTDS